jgi:hypothetical protein
VENTGRTRCEPADEERAGASWAYNSPGHL